MHSLHLCHHGYFVHKLVEQTLGDWGKMLTYTGHAMLSLIIKNLFSLCPMVSFHMEHKYLHTLYPFQEVHTHTHQTSSSPILLFCSF